MASIQAKSIKTNYALNLLRVASIAVITIFTVPYVSRVLGPENLGKVEYIFTILNYFVLFSGLGIPMYGIREISRCRNNPKERSKVVVELYLILLVTTLISYVGIFVLCQFAYFNVYKDLILIMCSMVFLSNIGAEWYFQGIENQLFITIRNVILRTFVFVLIVFFIKNSSDYKVYAFLLILASYGANLINFAVIIKGILKDHIRPGDLNIKRHFKPILTIFVATISVNIYLQLDNLLIGSISGTKYVGYYAIANKLIRFLISFITIIGAVLLPRVSYLYLNDKAQYEVYLQKSFNVLMLMSLPFTVFFLIYAETVIFYMGGVNFSASVSTMKILSPLCFIVSIAYFMGFIVLYPQNKEGIYTRATLVSAGFSLCINYFAIRYFQQNGAATVAVLSEILAILIMYYYITKEKVLLDFVDGNTFKILFSGLIMFFFAYLTRRFINHDLFKFILFTGLSFGAYFLVLLLLKEKFISDLQSAVRLRYKLRNRY